MKNILLASVLLICATFASCTKTLDDDPKRDPCTIDAPVCGDDGKTYKNECAAKKAGVKKWTKGRCK